MAKNPVTAAQKKLYDSMGAGATIDGIKAARKDLKAEWEKATPDQRDAALRDEHRRR